MQGFVEHMGVMRNAYTISVGKPEGKRPFRRQKCRWEDNIRMDLREIEGGRCRLDSSGSGQGSVVGSCVHVNEVFGSKKGRRFLSN